MVEIETRGGQTRMAQLSLDHIDREAFRRQLGGVAVS